MLKPICVPCQRFFRCIETGVYFTEGMPKKNDARPGTIEPEWWQPYKVWLGDKWKCEGCGAEIISGVGRSPVAEHYQPDFVKHQASLNAEWQVNDC